MSGIHVFVPLLAVLASLVVVAGDQGAGAGHGKRVTAATVDFFRKGSYSPALAATAPVFVPPSSTPPKSAQAAGTTGDKSCRDSALGESDSDTGAAVCMIWLQVRAMCFVWTSFVKIVRLDLALHIGTDILG